ncbi:MAG: 3'(2'),5'-bisphosphate nucleotidase CysQ, partial [Proteobacteria bacterium]|nr:3'(2'),5'-bisphosphate nucleotidase CysQ [Pseudomonadota bacterium]
MCMKSLIDPVVALAEQAGHAILEVYSTDFEVQRKADESPLTQADLAAHRCIVAGLERLTPDMPIISEEESLPDFAQRSAWERYWLIDPLDGTREFVNRNGEFTVNIALIDNHRPVFGVVHVPVQTKTYIGCE